MYLTHNLGFLGSPLNLKDIALDKTSNLGSLGSMGTLVVQAPQLQPVLCCTVVADDG